MDDALAPNTVVDAFEAAPDPAALFAPDGALLRANPAFRAAFRHAVTPQRPPWGRVTPPPFEDCERRFEAAAPDGRRFEWAERLLPDGRRLAFARDVTERARQADEVARAKTTLFATLTHELRTPLNGVLGMAGLLAQSKLDPAQSDYVEAVRRSGEHLLDLITEILDYSRLEAGRVALEAAPFDPEEVAQSVAELLSPRARDKGLEIIVVARADAPSQVRGDEGRVRQILFNLAGNAVKFTESGGVAIELSQGRPTSDGVATVRFAVRDTGPGVAPEKQAVIFEEFQQADAETARRYGGAGLGLAIVKRLADAMGGRVGLDSRIGRGAVFWADLPLEQAADATIAERPLQGLRIGIAAAPLLALALKEMVETLGGEPVPWPGAGSASGRIDALLLDHAIAQGETAPFLARTGAPVIALVPQEERVALEPYRRRGVAAYLLKPVRRASLADRVLKAARGHGVGPPPMERRSAARPPSPPAPSIEARVLLAEDNPVNALLARTLLTRHGCTVEVVTDGQQAVEAAARSPFDIIILDLRMPVLDGLSAARRIRGATGPSARAPIVALTADAAEEDRLAALAAGMDHFLTKPLEPQRLTSLLQDLSQATKAATVRI